MDNNQPQNTGNDDMAAWKGHTKNVAPTAGFEAEAKAAAEPAKQQAERAAEIERENMASAQPKPEAAPPSPAMPTGTANSVYPDSDHGVTSSQSQTPRFHFDNGNNPDQGPPAPKKSFFGKLFGR